METATCLSPLDTAAQSYFQSNDKSAINEIVKESSRLIRSLSRIYGGGCDSDDLLQAGRLGLMKAVRSFDPENGALFSTYASHCISGEIRHMVRKQRSFFNPGCIAELQSKVEKTVEEHINMCGREPDIAYIAEKLRIREESVNEVMRTGLVSLEEIDLSLIKSTSYESFSLPIEDRIALYQALKKLSDFNRRIMILLFFGGLTQQQVADKLGVSQKKVSRAKAKSIEQLREQLSEKQEFEKDHDGFEIR